MGPHRIVRCTRGAVEVSLAQRQTVSTNLSFSSCRRESSLKLSQARGLPLKRFSCIWWAIPSILFQGLDTWFAPASRHMRVPSKSWWCGASSSRWAPWSFLFARYSCHVAFHCALWRNESLTQEVLCTLPIRFACLGSSSPFYRRECPLCLQYWSAHANCRSWMPCPEEDRCLALTSDTSALFCGHCSSLLADHNHRCSNQQTSPL